MCLSRVSIEILEFVILIQIFKILLKRYICQISDLFSRCLSTFKLLTTKNEEQTHNIHLESVYFGP